MADLAARIARLRVPLGFACGLAVLWLAHPTWPSLGAGALVALAGETIRIWAAGHLEKGREVTKSGPYRWAKHPLYLGSSVMGVGVAIASASEAASVVIVGYLAITLTAAIRTEEAWLRRTFGNEYDAYSRGRVAGQNRRFTLARVRRNREGRAIIGLLVGLAILALKTAFM